MDEYDTLRTSVPVGQEPPAASPTHDEQTAQALTRFKELVEKHTDAPEKMAMVALLQYVLDHQSDQEAMHAMITAMNSCGHDLNDVICSDDDERMLAFLRSQVDSMRTVHSLTDTCRKDLRQLL